MSDRKVSVSRVIPQPAEKIFDLLTSPAGHTEIDGSGSVKAVVSGPEKLELGSRFRMGMRLGLPYRISSKVKEYEENRLIAWSHMGGHRWRYELEPEGESTRVTETFDWSYAIAPKGIELLGYPKKHPASMERTLERIEEVLESKS